MKPICVKCRVEMRMARIGVPMVDMASYGPQSMTMADVWQCPSCGCEVVCKMADNPVVRATGDELGAAERTAKMLTDPTAVRYWLNVRERDLFEKNFPPAPNQNASQA